MVNVCMISDFFYPSMGGVENHVYQLAQCLLMQGHKVVVVTHRYGQRCGVRWLPRGLKVYYLPFCGVHDRVVLPTGLMLLPLLRDVLIRERITMVHVHAHVENKAGAAGQPEHICQLAEAEAGGRPELNLALAGRAAERIGRSLGGFFPPRRTPCAPWHWRRSRCAHSWATVLCTPSTPTSG